MRYLFCVLLSVCLSACSSPPTQPQEQSASGYQLPHSLFCSKRQLVVSISDSPCSVLAWEHFLNYAEKTTPAQAHRDSQALGDSTEDRLRREIYNTIAASSLNRQMAAQQKLSRLSERLPEGELRSLLKSFARERGELLQQHQEIARLKRLNQNQAERIRKLSAELEQRNSQIEALTEIEQQLSDTAPVTGDSSHDTE